jgi:DNA-binding response OmpR family regulator
VLDRVAAQTPRDVRDIVEAEDFRIDVNTRSATVRGHKLHLNCTEFDVLVFLITHRRRLITSNTTLATKPQECDVRHAQFLPALLSLRKKLEEAVPGSHYIQTKAWVLYDFHPGV